MTDLVDNDIVAVITIPQVQKLEERLSMLSRDGRHYKNNSKFLKMKIAVAKMENIVDGINSRQVLQKKKIVNFKIQQQKHPE